MMTHLTETERPRPFSDDPQPGDVLIDRRWLDAAVASDDGMSDDLLAGQLTDLHPGDREAQQLLDGGSLRAAGVLSELVDVALDGVVQGHPLPLRRENPAGAVQLELGA